jgi:hypothetical protein
MTHDYTGPCALQITWKLKYDTRRMIWYDTGYGMTQDDTIHISCCKTFYFALILHWDDMGWHGMTPGCLPNLKHAFCIGIASKSIRDDTGWHCTMCPAKNMKVRIWYQKDDMGWLRLTTYSLHCKNTPFLIGNAQGWHGMTQDDTRLTSLQKYTTFDTKCPRMTWDDTGWH